MAIFSRKQENIYLKFFEEKIDIIIEKLNKYQLSIISINAIKKIQFSANNNLIREMYIFIKLLDSFSKVFNPKANEDKRLLEELLLCFKFNELGVSLVNGIKFSFMVKLIESYLKSNRISKTINQKEEQIDLNYDIDDIFRINIELNGLRKELKIAIESFKEFYSLLTDNKTPVKGE